MRTELPHHVMTYLEETWLIYKDRFVYYLLRGKLHFGITTTSRVEGAHATLKNWIRASNGDILIVETACKLACEGQLVTIRQQTALDRATADLQFGATFAAVMGKISVTALKLAFKQYKQRQVAGECSGNFQSTHGIPCKHLLRNSSPLACEDFHQHWWLVQPACAVTLLEANNNESIDADLQRIRNEFNEASQFHRRMIRDHLATLPDAKVFNPVVIRARGRPAGSLNRRIPTSATQRDPSHFEHFEASLQRQRRCGNCRQIGRNQRRCQNPKVAPASAARTAAALQAAGILAALGAADDWKYPGWPTDAWDHI